MFAKVTSGTIYGLRSYLIEVEVDFSQGLPCFVMVGSLKNEVKESAERVRIALKNVGISIPPMHIAVNLSPADIKKSGTGFDLPVALSLLCVMGRIDPSGLEDMLVLGELGLDGEVKGVNGVMPIVWEAKKKGISTCLVPFDNAYEASLVEGMKVVGLHNIEDALSFMDMSKEDKKEFFEKIKSELILVDEGKITVDFSDIAGQEGLKRGALIAVAGFHHLLIMGPPGTGKTMIARRIPSILPPLSLEEKMDVTAIYSIAGNLNKNMPIVSERPFVAPHHTVSPQGMAGGGAVPKPGCISLAHKGVLFLDELPEFARQSIDMLRQPLEEKSINISRSAGSFTYPADLMLVAAMNPCPCGYFPDHNRCNCPPLVIKHYLSHISGPILDRIDICINVKKVKISEINRQKIRKRGEGQSKGINEWNSLNMRKRVEEARRIQEERYKNESYSYNSSLDVRGIEKYCRLEREDQRMLEDVADKLDMSLRGYHRMLRVARTIADLDNSENINREHLSEAICLRPQLPEI